LTTRDDEPDETDDADVKTSDAELCARAARGERAAGDALYRRHAPRLLREVLLPLLRDEARAHDALCETFVSALPALARFDPSRGPDPDGAARAWLSRIARRKAIDELRRAKNVVRLADALRAEDGAARGGDALLLDHEDARTRASRIEAVLRALNPRYAEALRMRLLADWSRDACADALEIRKETFDVLLHRAVAAFRKTYVERYGSEPEEH